MLETTLEPGQATILLSGEGLAVTLRDRGPRHTVETNLGGISNAMTIDASSPGSSYAVHLGASDSLLKVYAEAARTHLSITIGGSGNVVEIHAGDGASDLSLSVQNPADATDFIFYTQGTIHQFRMAPGAIWTWPPPQVAPVVENVEPAESLDPLEREYLQSGIYANWAFVGMASFTALLVMSSVLVALNPRIEDRPLGRAMASLTRQLFPAVVILPLIVIAVALMR